MSSGPLPGEDCWRIARATKASVIIDAEAYFRHARAAMLKAKRRIMLIGWDFDAAIRHAGAARSEAARQGLQSSNIHPFGLRHSTSAGQACCGSPLL